MKRIVLCIGLAGSVLSCSAAQNVTRYLSAQSFSLGVKSLSLGAQTLKQGARNALQHGSPTKMPHSLMHSAKQAAKDVVREGVMKAQAPKAQALSSTSTSHFEDPSLQWPKKQNGIGAYFKACSLLNAVVDTAYQKFFGDKKDASQESIGYIPFQPPFSSDYDNPEGLYIQDGRHRKTAAPAENDTTKTIPSGNSPDPASSVDNDSPDLGGNPAEKTEDTPSVVSLPPTLEPGIPASIDPVPESALVVVHPTDLSGRVYPTNDHGASVIDSVPSEVSLPPTFEPGTPAMTKLIIPETSGTDQFEVSISTIKMILAGTAFGGGIALLASKGKLSPHLLTLVKGGSRAGTNALVPVRTTAAQAESVFFEQKSLPQQAFHFFTKENAMTVEVSRNTGTTTNALVPGRKTVPQTVAQRDNPSVFTSIRLLEEPATLVVPKPKTQTRTDIFAKLREKVVENEARARLVAQRVETEQITIKEAMKAEAQRVAEAEVEQRQLNLKTEAQQGDAKAAKADAQQAKAEAKAQAEADVQAAEKAKKDAQAEADAQATKEAEQKTIKAAIKEEARRVDAEAEAQRVAEAEKAKAQAEAQAELGHVKAEKHRSTTAKQPQFKPQAVIFGKFPKVKIVKPQMQSTFQRGVASLSPFSRQLNKAAFTTAAAQPVVQTPVIQPAPAQAILNIPTPSGVPLPPKAQPQVNPPDKTPAPEEQKKKDEEKKDEEYTGSPDAPERRIVNPDTEEDDQAEEDPFTRKVRTAGDIPKKVSEDGFTHQNQTPALQHNPVLPSSEKTERIRTNDIQPPRYAFAQNPSEATLRGQLGAPAHYDTSSIQNNGQKTVCEHIGSCQTKNVHSTPAHTPVAAPTTTHVLNPQDKKQHQKTREARPKTHALTYHKPENKTFLERGIELLTQKVINPAKELFDQAVTKFQNWLA